MERIIGAMLLGASKEEAVRFSFLLAVPTMAAATGLDLFRSHLAFDHSQWTLLLIGFGVSFVTAIVAIKFLLKYVQNHSFSAFGVYRIILAIVYYLL